MKKTKELVILIGNIASGKTITAKEYVKKGYASVSRDGLRYTVGSGEYIFHPPYEAVIRDIELYMLKRFLELGVNVVVDEVGINERVRKPYFALAKKYDYKIIAVVMPILSLKESLKRRLKDKQHGNQSKKIWTKVYNMFASAYEEPTLEEGFDKIIEERR